MSAPKTRFATGPDGSFVAYQVFGEAGPDIVLVNGQVCIDLVWDEPRIERFLRRLSSVGRVILFDRRGIGASDRLGLSQVPFVMAAIESAAEDIKVVLDAVRSVSATVIGSTAGGKESILFAATHPDRVTKLVLQDASARSTPTEGYEWGLDEEARGVTLQALRRSWGTGMTAFLAPSLLDDRQLREWFARNERLSVSRSDICRMWENEAEADVRSALALVQADTLVISHDGDPLRPAGQGRFLADHIPNARYVELSGEDTWFFVDPRVEEEILSFINTAAQAEHRAGRVLAAMLFTDIVSSTATAVELGDQRWRGLLDTHDSVAARVVAANQGRIVKQTGDGLLTTFDMPGRAVSCALTLRDELTKVGLQVRAGIHVGEVELRGGDLGGITVHVASRIMSAAKPGEILASRTVRDLTAGSGLTFTSTGIHELRDVPDTWELYRCSGP